MAFSISRESDDTADDPPPAPAPSGRPPALVTALSLAALLGLWSLAALIAADPTLPPPWTVARLIGREAASGALFLHLGSTLARVVVSFVLAMSLGSALGLWMGRSKPANALLDPWLVIALNLPALVVIVLCYLWIGLNEVAAVLAVAINKIPLAAMTLREGARALDPRLDDMASAYRMSRAARLRHVIAPQLAPYFAAAGRAGVSLIWKIVLVVELLGRSNGVGFQIHLYFSLFDVGMILAYALSFVVVMLAIEMLLLQPWERRAGRWRAP